MPERFPPFIRTDLSRGRWCFGLCTPEFMSWYLGSGNGHTGNSVAGEPVFLNLYLREWLLSSARSERGSKQG